MTAEQFYSAVMLSVADRLTVDRVRAWEQQAEADYPGRAREIVATERRNAADPEDVRETVRRITMRISDDLEGR